MHYIIIELMIYILFSFVLNIYTNKNIYFNYIYEIGFFTYLFNVNYDTASHWYDNKHIVFIYTELSFSLKK